MKEMKVLLKKYRKESILAPLFKLLEAFFDLLVPLIIAQIIDTGIASGNHSYILQRVLLLVVLAAIGMACSFAAQYYAARASVGFASSLRQALYDHIQQLSFTQLDQLGTGTMVTRLTSDINQVQTGLNLALRLLLRSPFIVLGSMIMAFTINTRCALVFAVAIPVLSVVIYGIMIVSIPLFRKVQTKLDAITTLTRENLTGVRVIRAFCRESDQVREFDAKNDELTKMNEFVGRLSALLNPLTYLLISIATVWLIQSGAVQVSLGSIQQGDVVALYNYIGQMIVELIKLASLIITLNKSIACANRVSAVLKIEPDMRYPETPAGQPTQPGQICFDHVSMAYAAAGDASLSDISFTAQPGQTIGIIGGTGSGKTSLVNLITRFYDAAAGTVSVGGRDVRQYARGELLQQIGVVPQAAVLFAGSIRDNLKWGNEQASDSDLWQALSTAQAKTVVQEKPGQLDCLLEQNGRNLSGGQKQRLTIARALVKQPAILILDDSASALDFATDAALRQAIRNMAGRMTTVIVSQRTSSIMQADQILVLNDGRLAGRGTHQQLLANCQVYQEIYYSQFPEKKPADKTPAEGREEALAA